MQRIIFIIILAVNLIECKINCLIKESKGFKDPSNIYQCSDDLECCLEYGKPSCCGGKPITQIM